jgi:hypothetical protein
MIRIFPVHKNAGSWHFILPVFFCVRSTDSGLTPRIVFTP